MRLTDARRGRCIDQRNVIQPRSLDVRRQQRERVEHRFECQHAAGRAGARRHVTRVVADIGAHIDEPASRPDRFRDDTHLGFGGDECAAAYRAPELQSFQFLLQPRRQVRSYSLCCSSYHRYVPSIIACRHCRVTRAKCERLCARGQGLTECSEHVGDCSSPRHWPVACQVHLRCVAQERCRARWHTTADDPAKNSAGCARRLQFRVRLREHASKYPTQMHDLPIGQSDELRDSALVSDVAGGRRAICTCRPRKLVI